LRTSTTGEKGGSDVVHRLARDEARLISANIAKLPGQRINVRRSSPMQILDVGISMPS
jgi:hypothetical protein